MTTEQVLARLDLRVNDMYIITDYIPLNPSISIINLGSFAGSFNSLKAEYLGQMIRKLEGTGGEYIWSQPGQEKFQLGVGGAAHAVDGSVYLWHDVDFVQYVLV